MRKKDKATWNVVEGVGEASKMEEEQSSSLVFWFLLIQLSDLDNRRRGAERRPAPAGRGAHRQDFTFATGEREATAEDTHSVFITNHIEFENTNQRRNVERRIAEIQA